MAALSGHLSGVSNEVTSESRSMTVGSGSLVGPKCSDALVFQSGGAEIQSAGYEKRPAKSPARLVVLDANGQVPVFLFRAIFPTRLAADFRFLVPIGTMSACAAAA